MQRDRVPAKKPLGHGQGVVRQRVAFKVGNEYGAAGEAVHVAQQVDDLGVTEVMQEQRAEDVIKCVLAKRGLKSVRDNLAADAVRSFGMRQPIVEQRELSIGIGALDGGAVVAGAGTDLQPGEASGAVGLLFLQEPTKNGVAAEVAVDAAQIGQAEERFRGGTIVQKLGAADPLGAIWKREAEWHCCYHGRLMELVTGNIGWIEVICGPMFSGKSEELIRRLRRAMIARKRVQVFKPVIDNRYSADEIVSHGDQRLKAEVVKCAAEIITRLDWRTQVIGIDEPNFLGPELIEIANRLADGGKQVLIAGLDTDYLGRPFAPIPELLALAESITKTLAICMRCGNPAKHTQRLVEAEDLIVVGAAGMYEARCRRCFEPGAPRQEVLPFARPVSLNAR